MVKTSFELVLVKVVWPKWPPEVSTAVAVAVESDQTRPDQGWVGLADLVIKQQLAPLTCLQWAQRKER